MAGSEGPIKQRFVLHVVQFVFAIFKMFFSYFSPYLLGVIGLMKL